MITVLLASTTLASAPACSDVLNEIEDKIQTNYVALELYRMNAPELAEAAAERYDMALAQADQLDEDDVLECTRILQSYVRSYGDKHLFLNSNPDISEDDAVHLLETAQTSSVSPNRLRQLAVSSTGRGPLVGVWAGDDFEAAVIPEADGGFIAIIVDSNSENWQVGDVVAHFSEYDGELEAIHYRAADRAPIRTVSEVVSDNILHMPPLNWGRIQPEPDNVIGVWDPYNPRSPRFEMISDNVAWISIPSFSPQSVGDSLHVITEDFRDELINADLLVVDTRGNNGGSSTAIAPLDPFIMTRQQEGEVDLNSPVLLSSPDTIGFYSRIVDQMPAGLERDVFADMVRRLEENPGSLVPLLTNPEYVAMYNDARLPEILHEGPANIAFLVDDIVMSAGEAVLLRAKKSGRVTSFGANTNGTIDYQNVFMVSIGEGALRFALGYPLMADNHLLPEGGYNQTGIPVDVPLEGPQDAWPQQVLEHYELD